jgi:hypothetical protein
MTGSNELIDKPRLHKTLYTFLLDLGVCEADNALCYTFTGVL